MLIVFYSFIILTWWRPQDESKRPEDAPVVENTVVLNYSLSETCNCWQIINTFWPVRFKNSTILPGLNEQIMDCSVWQLLSWYQRGLESHGQMGKEGQACLTKKAVLTKMQRYEGSDEQRWGRSRVKSHIHFKKLFSCWENVPLVKLKSAENPILTWRFWENSALNTSYANIMMINILSPLFSAIQITTAMKALIALG